MNSVRKLAPVSLELFAVGDEEPKTKTMSRPPPDDASTEFKSLIEQVDARIARRKKRPKTIAASKFNRALQEVETMISTGDWDQCTARHCVALYDKMHEKCYGVEAFELGPEERYTAAMMAGNLAKNVFDDDFVKVVSYMRWVWTREIGREKWRCEQGKEPFRISYRYMFSSKSSLLTDYKLALARKTKKP